MTTAVSEPPALAPSGVTQPDISVLVHVSDPGARIEVLCRAYSQVFADLGCQGELVFVLDGVAGAALEELERLAAARDDVRVLALQGGGQGESIAFKAALEHARAPLLLTTWDYLQIDPVELGQLLAEMRSGGADLVAAWRSPRIDPMLNRLQSRFFNWVLRRLSHVDLHDLNCNFRLMRREVLEEVTLYGDLFRFLPIMAQRRGFRVAEVKVRHLEERGTTGFFGLGVYTRRGFDILAVTFLTRFTRKPLRFFGIIGFVLIALGLAVALPPFVQKIFFDASLQDRPIVLVGVVLISFGLQFIGFGLVGEIIIFTQSRNLKDYKVDRVLQKGAAAAGMLDRALDVVVAEPRPPRERDPVLLRRPSPGEDVLLDHFVRRHPHGTVFHLSAWRRVVEDTCQRSADLLVAERDGEIVGFLPWFELRSLLLGHVGVSMPFAVYGGCLADDPDIARRLLHAATSRCEEAGCAYLELRHVHAIDPAAVGLDLALSDRYVTFRRDLPEDPADCLGMIPRKARAEARRGQRAGLSFVEETDLRLFHRLFAINKQALGSPGIPYPMLASLMRNFGGSAVMHQVRDPDGHCLATVLSFLYEGSLLPYYSGASGGGDAVGANNFMYFKLMEWGASRGLRQFDFGRSRRDSGPAHFKKNMGFEPLPLHYQYWLGKDGRLPEFHPDNPKLGMYQKLWRRLPAPVARIIGARLFKHLA